MNKNLQEAFTIEIRKMLDPIVEEAGYSPEDYSIVWHDVRSSPTTPKSTERTEGTE